MTAPIDPRRLGATLQAIERDWRDPDADWRAPALVLVVAGLCLFGIHYLRFYDVFRGLLARGFGIGAGERWLEGTWGLLVVNVWWGAVHLIGYVLVPMAVIRLGLRRPLREFGLGWGDTTRLLPWCAALAAPIVLFAFLVSADPAFQQTYPFYRLAGRSWVDLLLWQCIYLGQFAMLEFFFRGFLLHALAPRLGVLAIFVMAVPYLMIHFPKPAAEAFGALPFGLLLGILALRARSIWGGALVHMTVALAMDLMALWQAGQWPARLWPGT